MGRVALVTGGTRGIGAAISQGLKQAGYNVAANYGGNDEAAKAFSKETKIPAFKWDVGDYVACEQGVVNVQNEVGPIEVLVNNAGISRDAMLQKMTHEQWEQVIRTNLDSLFNMTRPVINAMREKGFGRIVNISSINGQKGQLGLANYCSAKAGVVGFTRALALESARKGITVNAIAPGYVKTDLLAGVSDEVMKSIVGADSRGTSRRGRRSRPLRSVPRRRRGGLDHRLDDHHQWRRSSWIERARPVQPETIPTRRAARADLPTRGRFCWLQPQAKRQHLRRTRYLPPPGGRRRFRDAGVGGLTPCSS